jgi:hypothetical protein
VLEEKYEERNCTLLKLSSSKEGSIFCVSLCDKKMSASFMEEGLSMEHSHAMKVCCILPCVWGDKKDSRMNKK